MLIIKQFPAFYVSLLLLIRNINSLFYDDLAENTLILIHASKDTNHHYKNQ